MAYLVSTIGGLGELPALRGQSWPDPSPDWVRPPALAVPSSPRVAVAATAGGETVNGYAVAGVVVVGVLVGALGLWAAGKWL